MFWSIIKADFSYYKNFFFIIYTVIIAVVCLIGKHEYEILRFLFLSLPMLGIFCGNEERTSRRIRLHASLPISSRSLVLTRFPSFIGFWLSLMLIFLIDVWIQNSGERFGHFLHHAGIATGLVILLVVSMDIFYDLNFYPIDPFLKKIMKTLILIPGILAALIYFAMTFYDNNGVFLFNNYHHLIFSSLSFISLIILCLILMGLSVQIYLKRISYLE